MTGLAFVRLAALALLAAAASPVLARQGWRLASGAGPGEAGRGGGDRSPWRGGAGLALAASGAGGRKAQSVDPEQRGRGREGAVGLGGGGRAAAARVAAWNRTGEGLDLRDWGGSRPAADRVRIPAASLSPAR